MVRNRLILHFVGGMLILAALACNAPSGDQEAAQTLTQVAAQALTPSATPGNPTSTTDPANAIATDTPTPTVAPGVTPSATICTYNSIFGSDVTIPDGTEFDPGESFTKTWRINNNGCESWPSGTQLVFIDGNQMGAPAGVNVSGTSPGGNQDISVDMKAPNEPGEHKGLWQLRTGNGIFFGDKVFVEIVVREPTITPTPTLTLTPTLTPTETEVPTADFDATYVSSWTCLGSGRVTFQIENLGTEPIESLSFDIDGPIGTDINSGSTDVPFRTASTAPAAQCAVVGGQSLAVDGSAYIWLEATPPAAGTSGRVVLNMCTENGLGGDCQQYTFDFTY